MCHQRVCHERVCHERAWLPSWNSARGVLDMSSSLKSTTAAEAPDKECVQGGKWGGVREGKGEGRGWCV